MWSATLLVAVMGNTSLRGNSFELQTLQQASFKLQQEQISKKLEPLMMHVWPTASSFALHELTFSCAKTACFWTQKTCFSFFFLGYLFAENSGSRDQHSSVRSLMGFSLSLSINLQLEGKTQQWEYKCSQCKTIQVCLWLFLQVTCWFLDHLGPKTNIQQ